MRTIYLSVLLLLGAGAAAQSSYYPIDRSHSQIKFIGHLGGMMDVEGTFSDFSGYLKYSEESPESTSITLIIAPGSVQSGNEWRDKHLKNPDFLDVEQYPELTFQSRSVAVEEDRYTITGELNLRGKTRTVELVMILDYPPSPDPWGNRRLGFQGNKSFSRAAMELGPSAGFWSGSIADEFEMHFTISASQQNMDRISSFGRSPMKEFYRAAENNNIDSLRAGLVEIRKAGKLEAWMVEQIALKLDQHQMKEQALNVYQLNAELFMEESAAMSSLARAYMDRGKIKEAREYARKALGLNPRDPLAMELLR